METFGKHNLVITGAKEICRLVKHNLCVHVCVCAYIACVSVHYVIIVLKFQYLKDLPLLY